MNCSQSDARHQSPKHKAQGKNSHKRTHAVGPPNSRVSLLPVQPTLDMGSWLSSATLFKEHDYPWILVSGGGDPETNPLWITKDDCNGCHRLQIHSPYSSMVLQIRTVATQGRSNDPERLGGGYEHLLLDMGEGHLSCPPCDLGMLLYEFYTIIMRLKATVITC